MATFVETRVDVELVIRAFTQPSQEGQPPNPTVTKIFARAQSYAADGTMVRGGSIDITDNVSAARQQGAADLLADVTARVKAAWGIA